MTKLGLLRLSYEKQDTLLKLLILSMAAVLCESNIFLSNTSLIQYIDSLCACPFPQHSPPDCFLSWGLKVSSMSLIRKCFLCYVFCLFYSKLPPVKCFTILLLGTSTTVQLASWQKKDFINFTTGLTIGPGILWGESLVAQFIQVGIWKKWSESDSMNVGFIHLTLFGVVWW